MIFELDELGLDFVFAGDVQPGADTGLVFHLEGVVVVSRRVWSCLRSRGLGGVGVVIFGLAAGLVVATRILLR